MDVRVMAGGAGIADSAVVDSFCQDASCIVLRIYDQSPFGNHLDLGPPGGAVKTPDEGVNATATRVLIQNQATGETHQVFGAKFEGGMGYRNDNTKGVAVDDEPESIYMVVAGGHFNDKCCFDYGNAETSDLDEGEGTMEAVYWGSCKGWSRGKGSGPWVMADLESGLWAGAREGINPQNVPIRSDFVTALLKGDSNRFTLKHADATGGKSGSPGLIEEENGKLQMLYGGKRPNEKYEVMRKQGASILGIGGDNSNWAVGTFFEGVITKGYASDDTDALVQENILNAGYSLLPAVEESPAFTFIQNSA
uniref:Alpha-L-arabinofuranosidase B catalytic domain-containing protein n=1 Tax=Chromera velia CCMP2878 TaxID=1169474 RepID=A0A0G4FCI0_9ALVE|eukprot:Cvel_16325.t1-p1 / transcript=Cvel_16325.t1 / gene=Cvel_16325 / organism=Chromera_velia_CCMP2878 / gene_product=Alpha-N-arabinofuranosidase B, putative / transcript_product=Alpha-N-arabinofuranosidase B, putative / location=Cvel_scaffold1253:5589-6509(+) / protein_length=307 / sequence_SO=supercontig / SO=protein_coding / is_pseudo=false